MTDYETLYRSSERMIDSLVQERDRLKLALDEIANFPRDVDEGVLKNIARRALAD